MRRSHIAVACLWLPLTACGGDLDAGAGDTGRQQFRLGVAHAHTRVFIDPPHEFSGELNPPQLRVELARNEIESTQLVIWPGDRAGEVTLRVDDVPAGLTVTLHPIGYIHLARPRFGGSRSGWYPDILLDNQPLQLLPREPQPVLVSVRSEASVAAGMHRVGISLERAGVARELPLTVEVFDFTLPRVSRFRAGNLFTWQTPDAMWPQDLGFAPLDDAARERIMYAVADLGFRNRLPPTFFFANGLRSWNYKGQGNTTTGFPTHDNGRFNEARMSRLIEYLLDRGANHFFIALTGNIFEPAQSELVERRTKAMRDYLGDYVSWLRRHGLLNKAYVYGIDEPWGDAVAQAKATYQLVKPLLGREIRFLQNTNQNNPAILDRLRGNFDAIDINLGWFEAVGLEAKRKAHKAVFDEVWWNVNLWPDARPNLFLEYPLVDARVIGSLSYSHGIQGFEYWQLFYRGAMSRYRPLGHNALRVDWGLNDKSMDGNLIYPGKSYRIYSSLRFEALRDGLEDLEYLYLLESRHPGHDLLRVPWASSIDRYETDPEKLDRWRRRIAEAIMVNR